MVKINPHGLKLRDKSQTHSNIIYEKTGRRKIISVEEASAAILKKELRTILI